MEDTVKKIRSRIHQADVIMSLFILLCHTSNSNLVVIVQQIALIILYLFACIRNIQNRSRHTRLVGTELHNSMRLTSGCLRPTQIRFPGYHHQFWPTYLLLIYVAKQPLIICLQNLISPQLACIYDAVFEHSSHGLLLGVQVGLT